MTDSTPQRPIAAEIDKALERVVRDHPTVMNAAVEKESPDFSDLGNRTSLLYDLTQELCRQLVFLAREVDRLRATGGGGGAEVGVYPPRDTSKGADAA
jgi:hypothetical protein